MDKYFDIVLLFIFSFSFAIYKIEVTTVAPFLIPVILLIDFIYAAFSILGEKIIRNKELLFRLKLIILCFLLLLSVGKSFANAVYMRHLYPKTYPIHDNPLQIEKAAEYLYQGKDPYSQIYPEVVEQSTWKENPAKYHVVTMPFYSVFSAVVLYIIRFFTGYFDLRLVHLLVFAPVICLFFHLGLKQKDKFLVFLILFFFNPFFVHFFISGRSDVFVFSFLFYSFYCLLCKKNTLSSFFLGLAFVSKQSSWLFVPIYFSYLYLKESGSLLNKIKNILKQTWPFFVILAVIIIPFLIWDAPGFINGVYNYPAGTLKTSFPIWGYGFSELLRDLKLIKPTAYFPFTFLQLIFGLPVFYLTIKFLKKHLAVSYLIEMYAVFLFVFWFFSRFFLDNYIGFIIMLFLTAELFRYEKNR